MKKRLYPLCFTLALLCGLCILPAGAVEAMEAVPCIYDDVGDFSEGLAAVKLNGKWGFIDKTGQEVIPCVYYGVNSGFSGGLAAVSLDSGEKEEWGEPICKWGYIDKTGQEVIPFKYVTANGFSEGFASVMLNGKWGFIDKTGKEVIPSKYTYAGYFRQDLARVGLNGKYGFIDQTGREVVPCKYSRAFDFFEDVAAVSIGDYTEGNEKWGYINKTGEEVIPCKYDIASGFFGGLASVKVNEKYGYIDKTGKEVIPFRYDYAGCFYENLANVILNGKWGYIDKTGKEVVPCKYNSAGEFSEGFAVVTIKDSGVVKFGLIDETGTEVVSCKYDGARNFSEGMIAVQLNGKWGFLAIDGDNTAYASTQTVLVDGSPVEFQCYALKDANGNDTNYIKLRDVASVLNGTAAQFNVGWDGAVNIETGKSYTPNGSEMKTPFSGNRAYETNPAETRVNGAPAALEAIVLKDDQGGAYTYYKLRDLGTALGFRVDWTAEKGIFIETK